MIDHPPQPCKACYKPHTDVVNLHLFVRFDCDAHVSRDVGPSLGEFDTFEDWDLEDFALPLPPQHVEGYPA